MSLAYSFIQLTESDNPTMKFDDALLLAVQTFREVEDNQFQQYTIYELDDNSRVKFDHDSKTVSIVGSGK